MTLNSKKTAFLILAVFLFVLDRYFKSLALANFDYIVNNWLSFQLVRNHGIAFSLPFGGRILVWTIILIVFGLVYFAATLLKREQYVNLGLVGLIILGALSNLIDRITLGYVVDYINLAYFTVFNLADVMISLSVAIFFWLNIDKKSNVC